MPIDRRLQPLYDPETQGENDPPPVPADARGSRGDDAEVLDPIVADPVEDAFVGAAKAAPAPGAGADTSDPVRQYLREIARTPLLSAQEEVALARAIEAGHLAQTRRQEMLGRGDYDPAADRELRKIIADGETARRRLTEANLRLVVAAAKKYLGHGLPILDLIQEGNIGLMRAAERYDYRHGVRFSTYAIWWIRQALTRALSDQARVIRLPVHMVDALGRYSRAARRLTQDLGREPTDEEIARAMDVPLERVAEIERLPLEMVSLDVPVGDETETLLADFVPDEAPGPLDQIAAHQLRDQLRGALAKLQPRERRVLLLHFGLDGEPRTLEEVGREFGVSRERIRQVEQKALRNLRHPTTAHRLRDFIA